VTRAALRRVGKAAASCAAVLALSCSGKSSDNGPGGGAGGGSAGRGGVSSGGAGASTGGAGGASAGRGGASSGGAGVGGTVAAGTGGSSPTAGAAGAPTGDWAAACNGVTMVGRCTNGVYEWCDYFERGLKRIDCGALGMVCRAEPQEALSDFTNAGCFGGACTAADEGCDGTLAYQCFLGEMTVHDCSKRYGPETTCGDGSLGAGSCEAPFCEPDRMVHCDGNVAVVCALDNNFYLVNCAEQDPAGTCEDVDPMTVLCAGSLLQTI